MEIWKDIKNFEGLYQISNFGNVKCLEHKCPGRYKGKLRTVKEHLMSKTINKTNGYVYVTLSNLDRGKTFSIHKLVAQAFIPNSNGFKYINHKDEDKQNNNVDNLEWCTSEYNNTYKDVHLRRKKYSHRKNYEKDVLIAMLHRFNQLYEQFKSKYSGDDLKQVDEMIKDIKCNGHS